MFLDLLAFLALVVGAANVVRVHRLLVVATHVYSSPRHSSVSYIAHHFIFPVSFPAFNVLRKRKSLVVTAGHQIFVVDLRWQPVAIRHRTVSLDRLWTIMSKRLSSGYLKLAEFA